MSRNASGNYSLPAGNPVVSGTTITTTWANATLSDIGTELTSSLDRSGRGAMLAPLALAAGSGSLPALTWSAETNTGLYRAGTNDIRMHVAATLVQKWTATGTSLSQGVTVTQANTDTAGVTTTGNGTGAGIDATGGSSGPGGDFTGGGTAGHGLVSTGGSSTGSGLVATGKGSSAGVASTGGATSGVGVAGTGGAPNGIGVTGTGTGTGAGATFTGGASGGAGVRGTGGTDAPGGQFYNAGGGSLAAAVEGWSVSSAAAGVFAQNSSTGPALYAVPASGSGTAIQADGYISLSSASNPSSSTAFTEVLTPKNLVKAWAHITTDGAGNISIGDGFHVSAVALTGGNTRFQLTLAGSLASTNFAAICTTGLNGSAPYASEYTPGRTAGVVEFRTSTGANLATTAMTFDVLILGAQ